jgi:hypothetical protein
MKSAMKSAVLLLSSIAVTTSVRGQCQIDSNGCVQVVPHFVKFAGALKDLRNSAPNGFVATRFVVYNSSTGGTPLWQEVQNVRLDSQGHYEIMLGVTGTDGIPMELFASGEPRWLGVQPLVPGQEEQPRILLVSVPYAMQAENAQELGGLPASAYAKVGVSASAPIAAVPVPPGSNVLIANPTPRSSSGQDITVSGATVNTIPKFSSNSSLTDSQITDQNGMVTLQNLSNILFADSFAGGVSAAIAACPSSGCIIYAVSPNVNLNLGTIDPGSKAVTIYLGPFTYTVNQITLRSGLKIIGMGIATTLQSVSGNNPVFVIPQASYSPAVNVVLSGFHVKGSAGNTSEDGFLLDTSSTVSSGLWYSSFTDIYIDGFAGIGLHIRGPNNGWQSLSQWVVFTDVIVIRNAGGGNGLRMEGGAFELRFENCQVDGKTTGDGTNIYIGGATGGPAMAGFPNSIMFEGLVSQQAATAVQIDGVANLTFHESHHEHLWGAYQINDTHNIWNQGVTIEDSYFAADVGVNSGSGYLLNVTTTLAAGISFRHNTVWGAPDSMVKATNLSSITYKDNWWTGWAAGINVPTTSGITTQMSPAATINIYGVHSVGLSSSPAPIATIQSTLGPGETVTFFAVSGPFTLSSTGNINLMGATSVTVNGSITFVRDDLTQGLQWIPISQWSPMR